MKSLLTAFGIDYEQWKALTIAALKVDFRTSQFGFRAPGHRRGPRPMLTQLLFYTLAGVLMGFAVSYMSDPFVAAFLVTNLVILIVGTALLVDHNSAVISPADYGILGFRPISSRTYFASKLTNILFYTLAITTAIGLPSVIAFFINNGAAVGAAAVVGLYACAVTVTLAVVVAYASLLRLVRPRRLRTLVSYLQFLLAFAIYGGYVLATGFLSKSVLASLSVPKTAWLLVYPGTWFASYVELAARRTGASEVLPVLASIVLLGVFALLLRGRLSSITPGSWARLPPARPRRSHEGQSSGAAAGQAAARRALWLYLCAASSATI